MLKSTHDQITQNGLHSSWMGIVGMLLFVLLSFKKKMFHQVSKCCEEISEYIQGGADEDPLVKGIPEEKNPFKEKGGCVVC